MMSSENLKVTPNEVKFEINLISKLENKKYNRIDYKIAVPPSFINENVIPRKALYYVYLNWKDNGIEKEESFMIKMIQKMGNYYKIAVPPDLINQNILPRKTKYKVTLKLLKQRISDGNYKVEKGEFIKIGEYDDDDQKEDIIEFV